MPSSREQILTAALEEIASGAFCHGVSGGNCPTGCPRDKARAALEAAAKAPGLSDDDALIARLMDVPIHPSDSTEDMRRILRAIDGYQAGGK